MKETNKKKIKTILLLSAVLVLLGNNQEILAEENHLIVRIVNAGFPLDYRINPGYTLFEMVTYLEIENPTLSSIKVESVCAPFPFPFMEINLDNESLVVLSEIFIEWVIDVSYIPPGITKKSSNIGFVVVDYENKQLPAGEYRFWFNYSVCSQVTIPVIMEGMQINVTENNVTYFFEHNNSTKFFDITPTLTPTQTLSTNETKLFFYIPVILIIIESRRKLRLKNILS